MRFIRVEDLDLVYKRMVKRMERSMRSLGLLSNDEAISGVVEEEGLGDDILEVLINLQGEESVYSDVLVEVHSRTIYGHITEAVASISLVTNCGMKTEGVVNTKYKTVAKKVRPVATQLPPDTDDHVQQAGKEPRVREARKIGHKFSNETISKLKIGGGEFLNEQEKKMFQDMLSKHGKAFASSPDEIGCVQPSIVAPNGYIYNATCTMGFEAHSYASSFAT